MEKLRQTLNRIEPVKPEALKAAQGHLDRLTKPRGSLGRLEDLARLVIAIKGNRPKTFQNKAIFTLAADHGVTQEGVSAFPKDVTAQMVSNFLNGGAAINVLARHAGARVVVADIGVAVDLKPHPGLINKKISYGTKNMAREAAMTRQEAVRAIETGIDLLDAELKKGLDLAGTGEMGIGNTTAASAITAVFTNKPASRVTGKGTGLDDIGLRRKIKTIEKSIAVNRPDPHDPLDVLTKIGGFEIAGLTGVILAAAACKIPVIIDGFISGAAALCAGRLSPEASGYMIASHCSAEQGHRAILDHMKHKPLLDMGLRLGEGTGAALAMLVVDAAVKIYNEMATFASAGVSEKTS
ncbi:MAG: nicotinate-nucleotide--dimethylbenzimidazole phosphoribosyltransferase [Candidatus Omnitrophica bacterium]|nr:nicotinate-nucleotide--dimethylbenzimidazole phosphoribosyltransferase [Candidatus Omnitrophota bacterium]MDD5574020.1 nicotinate-nucleotide--dimethylbenzimidazole phosphoribosyltransferase [Candidatus Omnitrophota bacterium]